MLVKSTDERMGSVPVLYTPGEIAGSVGVPPKTVPAKCREGKFGRFRLVDA
jgi:hypothetical protein